jgi:hypothetical protein
MRSPSCCIATGSPPGCRVAGGSMMCISGGYDGVIDKCLGSATGVKRHGGDPAVLATDFEITPVNRYAAIF